MSLTPALAAALLAGAPGGAAPGGAHLAVRTASGWTTFWREGYAPARWGGPDSAVTSATLWRAGARGISWGELELGGSGEAWRTRLVVARLDPSRVRLALVNGVSPGGLAPVWKVEDASDSVLLALNAGQFTGAAPWGWVVHAGREYRPPGRGPLATAIIVEEDGSVTFTDDAGLARRRRSGTARHPAHVAEAFQSYPALLTGEGEVPALVRIPGPDIDLGHRDARLAIGQLADGALLVVMTRFDALGESLGGIPFGLTVPEMAAVMGALGCRRAVALDGGVSAQLLVRDATGERHLWRGVRRVPLGLVATARWPITAMVETTHQEE
ncbi:MAG: phosphodiester glycosidase family protein [Gemmatimonadales bacterium]